MQAIIRNDLNKAFLAESEGRGYRPYIDGFKARDNTETPGFYLGSIQKCIRDDFGKRYFINVDMFNMGALSPKHPGGLATRASVQFHFEDQRDRVSDVSITFTDFDEVEFYFDRMWRSMTFGYSERI